MEDTLRKIGKQQANRVQNNIVIVTDERDNFNAYSEGFDGMTPFDEGVTVLRIPGMQFETVFSSISVNPYFGKGTIWVFSGGIHDLLIPNYLPDCLKFDCPTPLDLLSTRQCTADSCYLIQKAIQLNMNILSNTENDIALFSELLPVCIDQYNKFTMSNRSCLSVHSARPIRNVNPTYYRKFSKAVSRYNDFIELHARFLGYPPWRFDLPMERGKPIPLVNLLQFDGYNIRRSEELKNENRVRLMCSELLVTSSLTQLERTRAILIRGFNLKIITNKDLKDYFGEFGKVKGVVIHCSHHIGVPTGFGMVLFNHGRMAKTALSIGRNFQIKGVKLLISSIKNCLIFTKDLEAEVQNDEMKSKLFKDHLAIHPVTGTPWSIVWKRDGRYYFYNSFTRESVWERPAAILDHPEVDKLTSVVPKSPNYEPSAGNKKNIFATRPSSVIPKPFRSQTVKRHPDSSSSSRLSDLRVKSIDKEKLLVPLDKLLMKPRALIQNDPKDENELQKYKNRKAPMVNTEILKRKRLCVEKYKLKKFKSSQPQKDDVGSQLHGQSVTQDNSRLMIMENKRELSKNVREDSVDSKMDNCKKMNHTKAIEEKEISRLKRPRDFSATSLSLKNKIKTSKNLEKKDNMNTINSFSPLNLKGTINSSLLPTKKLKEARPSFYQDKEPNNPIVKNLKYSKSSSCPVKKEKINSSPIGRSFFSPQREKNTELPKNHERRIKNGSTAATLTSSLFQMKKRKVENLKETNCTSSPLQDLMKDGSISCKEKIAGSRQKQAIHNATDLPTLKFSQSKIKDMDLDRNNRGDCRTDNPGGTTENVIESCRKEYKELVKEEEFIDMNSESHSKDFKISFEDHLPNTINNVKVELFDKREKTLLEDDLITSSLQGLSEIPEELIHLDYVDNALEDPIIKSEKDFYSDTNIIDSSSAINPLSDQPDPCIQLIQKLFLEEYVQEFRKLQKQFEDEFMNYKRKPELHPTYTRYRKIFFALYNTQVRKILWNQFWYTKLESIKYQEWQSRYQKFTEKFRKRIEELTVYKSEVLECMKELFL